MSGHLLAWDPVAQKEVWRAQYDSPWNGGTLTTAGNLVFQGTAHGTFAAYRASDGATLWEQPAGTGIVAAPVTYQLDGKQYVAVMAGWGGAFALSVAMRRPRRVCAARRTSAGCSCTASAGRCRCRNSARTKPRSRRCRRSSTRRSSSAAATYARWCAGCHGVGAVGGGVLPDLRKAEPAIYGALEMIVLQGARSPLGMPRFDAFLSKDDVAAVRAYLLASRAALR